MKKIFITFLFIIFSSSFSLAKNNEKITMKEIKDILLYSEESRKIDWYMYEAGIHSDTGLRKRSKSSSYL